MKSRVEAFISEVWVTPNFEYSPISLPSKYSIPIEPVLALESLIVKLHALVTIDPNLSDSGIVEHARSANQSAELTALLKDVEIVQTSNLKKILVVADCKYAADKVS